MSPTPAMELRCDDLEFPTSLAFDDRGWRPQVLPPLARVDQGAEPRALAQLLDPLDRLGGALERGDREQLVLSGPRGQLPFGVAELDLAGSTESMRM